VEYFGGHHSQKEIVKCTIFLLLLVAMGLEEAWMEKISLGKEFLTAKNTRSNVLQTSLEQNLVNEPEKKRKRASNPVPSLKKTLDACRLLGWSSTAPELPSAASSLKCGGGFYDCNKTYPYSESTKAKKIVQIC